MNSCNAAVYDELCRYPMFIPRYVRTIKYWCKLLNTENIILKKCINKALKIVSIVT